MSSSKKEGRSRLRRSYRTKAPSGYPTRDESRDPGSTTTSWAVPSLLSTRRRWAAKRRACCPASGLSDSSGYGLDTCDGGLQQRKEETGVSNVFY